MIQNQKIGTDDSMIILFVPSFSANKRAKYCVSPATLHLGIDSSGIGRFRKVQSGSQPSFKSQTRSCSLGTLF